MEEKLICSICGWSSYRRSSFTKHCAKHKNVNNNNNVNNVSDTEDNNNTSGESADGNNNAEGNNPSGACGARQDIEGKTNNTEVANINTQIKLGDYLLLVLQKIKQIHNTLEFNYKNVLDAQDAKINRILTTLEVIQTQNNNILTRKGSNPFVVKLDN